MAHNLKIVAAPQLNKDLTESKTRKVYTVIDRHRKNRIKVGEAHNKKDLGHMAEAYRESVLLSHLRRHPNDLAFQAKHPDLVGVG